jgi:hypothetical protein
LEPILHLHAEFERNFVERLQFAGHQLIDDHGLDLFRDRLGLRLRFCHGLRNHAVH